MFINLEDETGMLNVVCEPALFNRSRKIVRTSSALLVRGLLEKADGAINLRADKVAPLHVPVRSRSRDWQQLQHTADGTVTLMPTSGISVTLARCS
jgi:error-prone DNA polymerase